MYKKIFILAYCLIYGYAFADPTSCQTYLNGITAMFEPISYTCDSGYYLPANVPGCRVCPSGYNCSGGTFVFNPNTAQGIVRGTTNINYDLNNLCEAKDKKYMMAVFVPDTEPVINISWDNDGETNTTSCVYGEEISLPPTPAPRVGYTFTGWKVVNNND